MTSSKWQHDFQPASEDRLVKGERGWIDRTFLKKYSLVSGIIIVFVAILWFIFDPSASEQNLPVISPPPGPYKTRPLDQNSDQETAQHKTIYEKLSAKKPDEQVEHILPEIEEPMTLPPTLPEEMISTLMNEDPVEEDAVKTNMSSQPVNLSTETNSSSSSIKAFYQENELEEELSSRNASRNSSEKTVEKPTTLTVSGSSVKVKKAINTTSSQNFLNTTYWVQLASAKSREVLEKEWKRLTGLSRLKPLLGRFKPVYGSVDMGQVEGIHHRLRIGPFSYKEAKALCNKLQDQKVECLMKRNQ